MSINTNIKIRTCELADALAILDIQREVVREGKYLTSVLEEFTKTLEEQKEWIQKIIENERETLLVAEINGEIVGWIVFISQNRKRLSHTGSFAVMIKQDYRNNGIGKLLIKELLAWAEENPYIEKVCLSAFSSNHRAIALYKALGFVEEGRKIKEFKFNEHEYVDDILMYKFV